MGKSRILRREHALYSRRFFLIFYTTHPSWSLLCNRDQYQALKSISSRWQLLVDVDRTNRLSNPFSKMENLLSIQISISTTIKQLQTVLLSQIWIKQIKLYLSFKIKIPIGQIWLSIWVSSLTSSLIQGGSKILILISLFCKQIIRLFHIRCNCHLPGIPFRNREPLVCRMRWFRGVIVSQGVAAAATLLRLKDSSPINSIWNKEVAKIQAQSWDDLTLRAPSASFEPPSKF